ncbi:DNA REPAIR PROTEIN XP-C / RAD4 [Salix purpurea]|uniref:DNA REPAIR PROTEIN XP-C / RAD4 n=1 Tax=Salix purpurea TaxID=77065 RepID=A0A9Q0WG50_SALPP|nr:DNA REPAIR PROTEIN XP-C / RAD4 [Salix purpurea]
MRTRSNSKQSSRKESTVSAIRDVDCESLADISNEAVDKLVRRVKGHGSSGKKKQDNRLQYDSVSTADNGIKSNGKQVVDARVTWNDLDARGPAQDPAANENSEVEGGGFQTTFQESDQEMDDIDWEDGSSPILDRIKNHPGDGIREVTIEFSESPDSAKQKPIRRATAEEKVLAELVHKVHLLCLLARGRIIDRVCDDPLIQASLLSILPAHLLNILVDSKLHAKVLSPLVHWFHNNFRVVSSLSEKRSFHSALACALEAREGTLEELAALSVALCRALKLTTRFVSILDVASIKPDAETYESLSQNTSKVHRGIFNTSTLMVDRPKEVFMSPKSPSCSERKNVAETLTKASYKSKMVDTFPYETQNNTSEECVTKKSQGSKRKGDLELEMQLQMAMSATAVAFPQSNMGLDVKELNSNSSDVSSPFKRTRKITNEESSSQGISTALGSRKIGSPLYWAEVYCGGENLTGKWVHVDAVHGIVDGEQKVEAAAAACKTSLRYVVAFAGLGAKDVTRRYCMKWYKIASQRINSLWWDAVLAPLRELESGATGGVSNLPMPNELSSNVPKESESKNEVESSGRNSFAASRNIIEDMELETRALTEPLPTNQQAYKNHSLYAIEKWLTKCQILHPKGPILGFCSGHPVYPRACVQTLRTKERWLREGLQVKAKELPAKVVKQSGKLKKVQFSEDNDYAETDSKGNNELYGMWQLEPLQLPHAVNGIVPKNERGQVDVWSEKCLPPGTVHLRLPRVFYVAKRLEIDYAPAMVGFEFRNGRSVPVFDGIVVCNEFKDAILEAYAEEEERRDAEEKKRNEAQAICRWYQLLSSIITRQRLNKSYGNGLLPQMPSNVQNTNSQSDVHVGSQCDTQPPERHKDAKDRKLNAPSMTLTDDHEHVFLVEDQSFDEETSTRTKRCHCGFLVQVEEL